MKVIPRNPVRLEIAAREPFAGGVSFGNTGAYERLRGEAHYAIDPDEEGLPWGKRASHSRMLGITARAIVSHAPGEQASVWLVVGAVAWYR